MLNLAYEENFTIIKVSKFRQSNIRFFYYILSPTKIRFIEIIILRRGTKFFISWLFKKWRNKLIYDDLNFFIDSLTFVNNPFKKFKLYLGPYVDTKSGCLVDKCQSKK